MENIQDIDIKRLELNKGQVEGLPKNPRFIRDERYKALVKSIEDAPEMLKLRELLVVEHGSKFVVIGGNMRLRACKELGMETVPCKVLPADTPVAKLREYAIKDNNGFGEDDWDVLANEWDAEELQEWGVEFPMDWDVDGQGDVTATEDDFDESEVTETVCKRGEVWQLGEHRLMCGDSTNADDVAKLMNGERADLVFTDPPYGMKYTRHIPKDEQRFDMLKNDDTILDFFPCVQQFSDGFVFVCTTFKVLNQWLPLFCKYLDLSNMIIWYKGGGGLGDLRTTFAVDYEVILVSSRKHEIFGKRIGSVWECGRDNGSDYDHPTQKPVALSGMAIDHTTKEGGIVLDLFGGTGTTLIAAEQLGRKCRMMELDPHYCDVIIARWEKLTGQKAERISDG